MKPISEWTDDELRNVYMNPYYDESGPLAAEVLRLRPFVDLEAGLREYVTILVARAEAAEIERDAALSQLRQEQTLRDHAEAHVKHLEESYDQF